MYEQGITCAAHGSMGSDGNIYDIDEEVFSVFIYCHLTRIYIYMHLHMAPALCLPPNPRFLQFEGNLSKGHQAESFVHLGKLSIGFLSF